MSAWKVFLETIRRSVLSHDSFMIFAIASLFYLVFYALPYDNQVIVKIPTAIVDMDQSRLSQNFTERLKSAPSVNAVLQTSDLEVAKAAFKHSDVDVIITMPSCMGKIGPLGRVLGPRGLMPNPKSGTVTMDVAKAVKEVKQGKIDFKVDKTGIIHASIGKVSFSADQIYENAKEFISTVIKLKPAAAKGTYVKSIFISSTMSKGVKIDPKSVE